MATEEQRENHLRLIELRQQLAFAMERLKR